MLTRRGLAALVAAVAFYVIGIVTHWVEPAVLAFGLLVALLIGAGWVARRPRLRIDRTIEPRRVTRGEVALGRLTVSNRGLLAVSSSTAAEHCGDRIVTVALPRLTRDRTSQVTYRLPTDRRAVLPVGPLSIERSDPFGLWRLRQRAGSVEQLWVHPVVHLLHAMPPGRSRSLDGSDTDRVPFGSTTFHALREYVPGDDLRHVHWRSSARIGTLMVREHVDTSLPQLTLVLDTSTTSHDPAHFEEAVEAAASVAAAAGAARFPVRLLTTGGRSVGARGTTADTPGLLDVLSEVQLSDDGSLQSVVATLALERHSDLLVVITGSPRSADLLSFASLGRRFDRMIVGIITADPTVVPVSAPPGTLVLRASRGREFADAWSEGSTR
jgi:uncharacterized protein (DUF58 family)